LNELWVAEVVALNLTVVKIMAVAALVAAIG